MELQIKRYAKVSLLDFFGETGKPGVCDLLRESKCNYSYRYNPLLLMNIVIIEFNSQAL